MAPCVARPSADMVLIMQGKRVLIFHKEGLEILCNSILRNDRKLIVNQTLQNFSEISGVISQEIPHSSIAKISLKITYLIFH